MNLAAMRAALRPKIGNPSTAEVPDTTLNRILNTAGREIASKYPFHETRCIRAFATVSGTSQYAVPPDMAALFRVWDDTNKKKLQKRGVRFIAVQRLNVPNGKPGFYVHSNNFIQLVPTPDAIYNINVYYLTIPADLVADTDVPVFPQGWHDGQVIKARHIYYDERGDIGKAIYAKNEWKDWVSDKPSEIDMEKDDLEDAGVIVASLGGENYRTFAGHSRDYRHFPSAFDTED